MSVVVEFSTCHECGDDFYTEDLSSEMVCSGCVSGLYCCNAVIPAKMNVSFGFAMATCDGCSIRVGYWDCACELDHDCREYNR
jgi:hypothetical protein